MRSGGRPWANRRAGVGAGETRGHGGWLDNRVIFPLVTGHRDTDKDRQEALIAASWTDWTILRPAPVTTRAPSAPLEMHTTVPPGLRAITRDEVAGAILDELTTSRQHHRRPFIGHR